MKKKLLLKEHSTHDQEKKILEIKKKIVHKGSFKLIKETIDLEHEPM